MPENHNLVYTMEMTTENYVVVKEDGNIELDSLQEIIDISNTHLYCYDCHAEGLDLYEVHNISREYEVL